MVAGQGRVGGRGNGGCGEGVGWFVLVNGSGQEMDGARLLPWWKGTAGMGSEWRL
jgi:hypothetical protein